MDHKRVGNISRMLLSGQVDFDLSQEVHRTCEIVLSDPRSRMGIDPNSPEEGAMFMHRMIKIIYSVADIERTEWFHIPLFVGPITALKRNGLEVTVNAAGKETLGYSSFWNGRTIKKNFKLTEIIEIILRNFMGETRFNISQRKKTTNKQTVLGTSAVPWLVIRKFAGSLNLLAFYDGRGVFQLRSRSKNSNHKFDGRNMLTEPTFTYDPSTIINSVKVIGGKPKGSKNKVKGRAVAERSHPLSPWRLGRKVTVDGEEEIVPRYYTLVIEDSSLKSKKACNKRAQKALEKGLEESINVEFDALPGSTVLMEDGDSFTVSTDEVSMKAKAVQWSVGLTHDSVSSVGVIKKVSFKAKKKGKKKGRPRGGRPGTSSFVRVGSRIV